MEYRRLTWECGTCQRKGFVNVGPGAEPEMIKAGVRQSHELSAPLCGLAELSADEFGQLEGTCERERQFLELSRELRLAGLPNFLRVQAVTGRTAQCLWKVAEFLDITVSEAFHNSFPDGRVVSQGMGRLLAPPGTSLPRPTP